jgi:flagella basal body P-ring formation protein FlgA
VAALRLLLTVQLLAFAHGAARQECVKVEGDRILASHLAGAVPAMSGIPPDTVIGFSPKLGVVRWLAPEMIQSITAKHAIRARLTSPVCVERAGTSLDPQDIVAALSAALKRAGHVDFTLEVLDYPKTQFPVGELEFSMSGLHPPHPGKLETHWRGRLRVNGGQSVPLVVRVEVSVEVSELRASRDIAPGQVITAEDISMSTRRSSPGVSSVLKSPSEVVGKQCWRMIKAGSVIQPHLLTMPPAIQRGDRVLVAASSGQAAISVETKADTSARLGQTIVLTNPVSGKKFKAKVTGRGLAAIRLENPNDQTSPD